MERCFRRRRSHSCSLLDDVIVVEGDEVAQDCLMLQDQLHSLSTLDYLGIMTEGAMGDEQPRYGLRSSPMKATMTSSSSTTSNGRQMPPEGRPAPPIPRQFPSSPKKFAAMLARAQSAAVLPESRDVPGVVSSSSVDQKRAAGGGGTSSTVIDQTTTASRKLSFGLHQPSLSSSASVQQLQPLQQAGKPAGLKASGASTTGLNNERRSLRKGATFFSLSTSTFVRRDSTACLPVAPLVRKETTVDQAAAAPAAESSIPPPRRSKSKLEPLQQSAGTAAAAAAEQGASSSSFARPALPPRPPQHVQQDGQQLLQRHLQSVATAQRPASGLQRSGGGLSRSVATARLLPAAEVLRLKEEERSESAAGAAAPTAADTAASSSGEESEKRSVLAPPPVLPPRRTLVPSASVACLSEAREKEEEKQQPRQSRPLLAPSPSTSAIRVRPASPSRTAKTNSGLLRSYSSVVVGAAFAATSATVSAAAAAGPPESPSKRARSAIVPRLPPKPVARSAVAASTNQEGTVVSTTSIVLEQKEKEAVQTPEASTSHQLRARLAPSPSESSLRKRPPTPRIVRSSSSSDLPINNRRTKSTVAVPVKDTVIPNQQQQQRDTVVPGSPAKQRPAGPPASPIKRSLKRRLQSPESEEAGAASAAGPSTVMDHRCTVATGGESTLPSASFFLRDNIVISDAATPPPLVVRGNGPGAGVTLAKFTPETTPKAARRSKKMRRLEMENGEVDDEARELAVENSRRADKPLPRSSPCKTGVNYAGPRAVDYAAMVMDEDGESSEPGPAHSETLLTLPPPPEKSALRTQNKSKGSHSVRFRDVHVFLFGRDLGYLSVPTSGELCLGMEARHHDEENHRLDGEEEDERMEVEGGGGMYGEDEEELSEGEIRPLNRARLPAQSSPRRLSMLGNKNGRKFDMLSNQARMSLLKKSGVAIRRDPLFEHEYIRQRRKECGCSCAGGNCDPRTCECHRDGIPCQVDDDNERFPCKCSSFGCNNAFGRVEFNPQNVAEHRQLVKMRQKAIERQGADTLGSPSHIRFADEDDEKPKHNATSYLETPPPAIYKSPSIFNAATLSPSQKDAEKILLSSVMPSPHSMCTPPMQQLQQEGGARATNSAARAEDMLDPPHPRFPVTPVYKKFVSKVEKADNKEMSLARLAIFQSASSTTSNQSTVFPSTVTLEDDVTIESQEPEMTNLDDSMSDCLSNYATPPEGRSPATVHSQDTVAPIDPPTSSSESQPPSPRKFSFIRSLI